VLSLAFAVIYKFMPSTHIRWRDVWVGAGVTSLLFAIGKWAIGLYLGKSDVASSFGLFGSLALMMIWVYYSAQIFLFGAEFTRVFAERYGSRKRAPLVSPITPHPAANEEIIERPIVTTTPKRHGGLTAMTLGAALLGGALVRALLKLRNRPT